MKTLKLLFALLTGFFMVMSCDSSGASQEKELTSRHSAAPAPVPVVIPDGLITAQCNTLEALNSNSMKVVYYFDGDCAFCIGRLKQLEALTKSKLGNVHLINIASTHQYAMFRHNLSQAKMQTCVLIDTADAFYKVNDEFLLNQIGLVNESGDRVYEGNILEDEDALNEFRRILNIAGD